jgi:hypothetical protein
MHKDSIELVVVNNRIVDIVAAHDSALHFANYTHTH